MNGANDNDKYTYDTKEQALEAATRGYVLEMQSSCYGNEELQQLTEMDPDAEQDEAGRWWAYIYDNETGGVGYVAHNLEVEWVG